MTYIIGKGCIDIMDSSCVDVCPVPDCIKLNVMDKNKVIWKRKESGEYFQLS